MVSNRLAILLTLLLSTTALAGCIFQDDLPPGPANASGKAVDDVVVIAVVDSGFNPYLWDLSAAHMPQHRNNDTTDDLPLDQDPATWLPGHPGATAFESYTELPITLNNTDPKAAITAQCSTDSPTPIITPPIVSTRTCGDDGLYEGDEEVWDRVNQSSGDEVHLTWIPNTKVVGYVNFRSGHGFATNSHGVGTTTVSAGNLHGTCPECVLVFVNGFGEEANEWVEQQDWIDVQTNSYGLSLIMRDRLYAGSDVELQREAVERGQAIFFSAGNGQANTFTAPNPTLWSSQEGPDWIVTVGAISPGSGASYSGHGKPADIASVGSGYPSGGGGTVTSNSTFGGTSNATPVTAGIYARALWLLRREMADASRVQTDGIISIDEGGPTTSCGSANADCAVQDGVVTVHELLASTFRSAEYTPAAWGYGLTGQEIDYETEEMKYMAEGHGSFWGRMSADYWWEESERILGHLKGEWDEPLTAEEDAWFIADSYCRQSLWGTWEHGAYNGETSLPPSDPANWPVRTWLTEECDDSGKMIHGVVSTING